jgi:zinc protease
MASRWPITPPWVRCSIEGAHQDGVRAFHARWYRPENAVIVIAGDADPRLVAALIAKWFGDWPVKGQPTPQPDFGAPQTPPGADPANPVGRTEVLVEPALPRSVMTAVLRPGTKSRIPSSTIRG